MFFEYSLNFSIIVKWGVLYDYIGIVSSSKVWKLWWFGIYLLYFRL